MSVAQRPSRPLSVGVTVASFAKTRSGVNRGDVAERLPALRAVDALEADPERLLVTQHGDSVTVRHPDDARRGRAGLHGGRSFRGRPRRQRPSPNGHSHHRLWTRPAPAEGPPAPSYTSPLAVRTEHVAGAGSKTRVVEINHQPVALLVAHLHPRAGLQDGQRDAFRVRQDKDWRGRTDADPAHLQRAQRSRRRFGAGRFRHVSVRRPRRWGRRWRQRALRCAGRRPPRAGIGSLCFRRPTAKPQSQPAANLQAARVNGQGAAVGGAGHLERRTAEPDDAADAEAAGDQ